MKYTLRPYQSDAVDIAWHHMKTTTDSQVLELSTGAGKSLIIADLAHRTFNTSGKKVLCLGPNKEIVEQNYEKYLMTGEPASVFSASAGKKCTRHPVVFGSPQSVKNALSKFTNNYAAIIVDECHMITTTVKLIIAHIKQHNPLVRIIGVTATPYRMNTGYIYQRHFDRGFIEEAIEPYFDQCTFEIKARQLIDEGFLTPAIVGNGTKGYDTSNLILNKTGNWDAASVDRAFTGQGRKTSLIVSDIVAQSQSRKAVMIFAATIKHAQEVMESLPTDISAMVIGDTSKTEREDIINKTKLGKIKYLVSVGALTTGIDITTIDVIALLRSTESASLLQQIIGRGLRLHDEKKDCLVLDYAENIERHCPGGDIFDPAISVRHKGESEPISVSCELCNHDNEFTARPNPEGFEYHSNGYFTDLNGLFIEVEGKKLPSHYGRRCTGYKAVGRAVERCAYKWSFKECEQCGAENDIAARRCTSCKSEIVNPNDKLKIEAAKLAKDPYATKYADVTDMEMKQWPGKNGKQDTMRVDFFTEKKSVSIWLNPLTDSAWMRSKWHKFCEAAFGRKVESIQEALTMEHKQPLEIGYRKKKGTQYLELVVYEFAK